MSITTNEVAQKISSGTFQYLLLMAANYTSWVIRVQATMEDQGVREVVEPVADVAVDTRKDKKAKSHLLQALPKDLLMQVAKKATAKEVWDCLKTRFVGADQPREEIPEMLKIDFDTMKMQKEESLDQYAGRLTRMSIKYANLGGTLSDAALVKKLFDTIPNQFLSIIASIEQFCYLDNMLFEEAVGRLNTYEEHSRPRAFGTGGNGDAQLLLTQAEWEAQQKRSGGDPSLTRKEKAHGEGGVCSWGGRGRGRRHGDFSLNDRVGGSRGGGRDKSHICCFNCDKLGHYTNRCKAPKKKEGAHLTQADDTEPALLLAELEEMVSAALEQPEWQDR
ncbi:uncharacterized protein LOC116262209 [Nymphaea colorata]|uniref:uncharacterized protein LOC116262209 n=1 Tax=Nymphaea colorata TaxID=210225 RepID=UPI00129DEE68|nr:uncharacterized protein LOC116262209 [Nymphaea colorata]